MTHDFTNKAILCETWQQMLHLAKLAEWQGACRNGIFFLEEDFDNGCKKFFCDGWEYWCGEYENHETPIPYTTFINPPVDDSVYGC